MSTVTLHADQPGNGDATRLLACAAAFTGDAERSPGTRAAGTVPGVKAWPSRIGVAGTLTSVLLGLALLGLQNAALDARLAREEALVNELQDLVVRQGMRAPTREELTTVRARIESDLSTTLRRVAALEESSQSLKRAIAAASRSIVFLQGTYGFVEGATGRALRYVLGPNGQPVSTPRGPAVSLDGSGPVVEARFAGTAFVATPGKLLLTNRHVAIPWEGERTTEHFARMGLVPIMHRFVGYLPGLKEPFDVEMSSVDNDADVALLRAAGIPDHTPHLELSTVAPRPGDDVVVLGYPTGVHALLVRIDPAFVHALEQENGVDFWEVGRRLAAAGHVSPLATRGIVGQVTATTIVYDADTAQGGSGGPVIGRDGKVLAVNTAIIPEFNGSNLGVPVEFVHRLLTCTALSLTTCRSDHDAVKSEALASTTAESRDGT